MKIDKDGLQNTRTGERTSMILPSEIEVKIILILRNLIMFSIKKFWEKVMGVRYIKQF